MAVANFGTICYNIIYVCTFLFSENQGEFQAKFVVIVDKNEFDTELEGNPEALTVQEALNRTVRSRRVGGLAVDTESLRVGETGETRIFMRLTK